MFEKFKKRRQMKFEIDVLAIKDKAHYKKLIFTTTNKMFGEPTLDVKVLAPTIDDAHGLVVVDEYFNINARSLGYYDEMLKERLNMADEDAEDYYIFRRNKSDLSALFDVMSALTGCRWYY